MAKARMSAGLVASGVVALLSITATAGAAPTVAQMLGFRPKQEGVAMTTPGAAELDKCKVELVKAGKGSGWLLKDEKGEMLRRYMDTNGDNKIDVWSYYSHGQEIYREIDSNYNDKVDQYRWFTTAGTRWGIDPTEDGKVKTWKTISPEEIGQEVLQAILKRDYARFQALLISEADIKALELPAAEANRVRQSVAKAGAKFQDTLSKVGTLDEKTRVDHLELAVPQCLPTDSTGMKQDLVRYGKALLVYQAVDASKGGTPEAKGLQLGELIQVGSAWKLIDAPAPSALTEGDATAEAANTTPMNKELETLLKELGDHDKTANTSAAPAELCKHNLRRADILEKMAAVKDVKPEDREIWIKQIADCLSVASQNSGNDKTAAQRLTALREKVAKEQSKALAAYVLYAEITAEYNVQINGANPVQAQKELLEKLSKFVTDNSEADNAPDAMLQLGMISELMNDEGPAKKWYEMFLKNYPNHPQVGKIKGAKDRLELDGKELTLSGGTLLGSPFDLKTLKGKVVVVYYWASWNGQCGADLEKLKTIHTTHGVKGFEVVCVNLDDNPATAKSFLQGKQAPVTHLYEQGGMAGKLAEQFGIQVLPTLFLVGKDGKVISHGANMSTVEEDVKKALN